MKDRIYIGRMYNMVSHKVITLAKQISIGIFSLNGSRKPPIKTKFNWRPFAFATGTCFFGATMNA